MSACLVPSSKGRLRAALVVALPLAFAAAGALLSVLAFAHARQTAAERFRGGFRFDAYQRAELVLRALGESQQEFESLRRFYSGSEDVTREELEVYSKTLLEDGLFSGFAWLGPRAAARVSSGRPLGGASGGASDFYVLPGSAALDLGPDGAAAAAMRDAIGRAAPAALSPAGAAAAPYRGRDGSFGVVAAACLPAGSGPGRGGCVVALVSLEGVIERAIGSAPPIGLPSSIYELDGASGRRLLMFHEPRLDARLGRPVKAPDPEARHAYSQDLRYFGRLWSVRIEASPAYVELRRASAPLAILLLGLASSALGALYVRRLLADRTEARIEAARRAMELERYFTLGRDLFCIADSSGRIRRANDEWERCLGYLPGTLVGRPFLSLVRREDRAATKDAMRELVGGAAIDGFAHRVVAADGGTRWLEWRAAADADSGLAYAAARDVSDRVRTEALLTASVREKEALIREIHHRVKNNMQVISSLVSLETRAAAAAGRGASSLAGGEARIQGLVRAMSLVHEAVYCSPELDSVRMAPYLRDLVAAEASVAPGGGVSVEVRVGEGRLDLERATLVGLAADELVAESIRRARAAAPDPSRPHGLLVEGGESPEGGFWFEVRDGGSFALGDADADGGIGLSLVEALVAQMGGRLVVTGEGASIRLPA